MLDSDWAPSETTADPPAGRLYRTDIEALAEQLANGRRLAQGCVMMIGLDAIRERLGDRWPRRREQVWEAVDRLLERRLAPDALHARVGEVDYLIEAGATADQAQAVSFKLLQELHLFFLGERRLDAMRIESVVSFDGRNLLSQPVEGLADRTSTSRSPSPRPATPPPPRAPAGARFPSCRPATACRSPSNARASCSCPAVGSPPRDCGL